MPRIPSPFWPKDLSEDDLDWLEDRSAQREFMGGQSRAEAERGAVGDWEKLTGPARPHFAV